MKPVVADWTIVLAGSWNPAIFSLPWVANNIYNTEKLDMELLTTANSGNSPTVRYNYENKIFIPSSSRLIYGVKEITDELLIEIESEAKKTMELLPHTPMTGFGVNFGFEDKEPEQEILSIFDLKDDGRLSDFKCKIDSWEIQRAMTVDNKTVNFRITLTDDGVKFAFNYHNPVTTALEASSMIENLILINRGLTYGLLAEAYGITVEVEEDGE